LFINGFKEVNNISNLPEIWKMRVPRAYPFVDNRLDRFIPIPSYFIKDNLCVVMISANGVEKIIKSIDLYLSNMNKGELKQIDGVCAIFDADQKLAKDSFNERFTKNHKDMIVNKKDFLCGECNIRGEVIKLYYYFFPDNYSQGTLENLLLDGAKVVYSDLLDSVNQYLNSIDEKYKENWGISSENKVKVGCIANVFRPGSANQISIRFDDWISQESIINSPVVKKFYEFIVNILKLN
ncbi:MAG: hypothetical protein IJH55_10230, partial [Romboutsia sp.]|nr:hypothetical protein [Romboutsia sp.]